MKLPNLSRFLTFLLVLGPLSLFAKPRKFVSSDGKTLEAEVVTYTDTSVVLRRTSDDKEFTLPFARLSEADQAWIKESRTEDAPVPHPLGWKRLRIHVASPDLNFKHATIRGEGIYPIGSNHELYLSVGTWLELDVNRSDYSVRCLVRYDGSADWHVDNENQTIVLRSSAGGPKRVVGVKYEGSDADAQVEPPKRLSSKDCAAAIIAGAGVETSASLMSELIELKALPESLCLLGCPDGSSWKKIPPSVRALSISGAAGEELNLSGVERLTRLEHLEIRADKVTGFEALTKIPKLELLSVNATVSPDQVAFLGKLSNLRHLSFLESSKGPYPKDAFDCVGELKRLESACFGSHYVHDKHLNPGKVFRNCPNLTVFELNHKSINDKGAFLEALPNLTEVDFYSGQIPIAQALKLMDSGHFKHVRRIITPSDYPLRNLPSLRRVDTVVNPMSKKNFEKFEAVPSLRELVLNGTRNEDLSQIATHPAFAKVRSFTLSHSSADDLSGLRDMPALRHLELFYHKAPRVDISSLASLEALSANSCATLASLKLPGGLEELKVWSAKELDFTTASPLPQLRRLRLEYCTTVKTLAPLAPCPELTHLLINGCKQLADTGGLEKGSKLRQCIIKDSGKIPDRED